MAHLVGADGLCEEQGDKGEGEAAGAAHDVVAALAGRSHALQQSRQPPSRQPIQRRRRLPQQPALHYYCSYRVGKPKAKAHAMQSMLVSC